jgi:hypothetical protein
MRMTSNTCCNCGGILVNEPLSESNGNTTSGGTDIPSWLEHDGDRHFIRCKECPAKNILIISEDPSGTPVLTVSRAIIDYV